MLAFRTYSVQTRGQHSAMSDALSIRPRTTRSPCLPPGIIRNEALSPSPSAAASVWQKEGPAGLCVGPTAVLDITGLSSNADKGLFVAGTVSLGFGFEAT